VKHVSAALGLASLAWIGAGCAMGQAPVVPPPALVQSYHAPLDIDHDESQLGAKRGTSVATTILGLVTWGDAGTHAAARQGGITTIRSADYEFFTVFGIYSTYTTIVYGD
jgi:hypothetical protein